MKQDEYCKEKWIRGEENTFLNIYFLDWLIGMLMEEVCI